MEWIRFDGKRSIDFGLYLENKMTHESTGYDIEQLAIPGYDGVILRSNRRLKPVPRAYPFVVRTRKTIPEVQEALSDWLVTEKGFVPLMLSWDDDYIYKAAFLETLDVAEVVRSFGRVVLHFMVHPIKYYRDGQKEIQVTNGQSLRNRGNVVSEPIITLTGTGNGVLTINGRNTELRNVQGGLVIDMVKRQVYHGSLSQWDKIYRLNDKHAMPSFDVGENIISWTGNFSVKVVPNWGRKI